MHIYHICTAAKRTAAKWQDTPMSWDELQRRCSEPKRTRETSDEYRGMSKDKRNEIKDVGGFVGGRLTDGKRVKGGVTARCLVTLDADAIDANARLWEKFKAAFPDVMALCYSTHSHRQDAPCLRLVIPLSREVRSAEYEPISRRVCERIGIDYFDRTTHDINRLFYWPSVSKDAEFYYKETDGKPLDADEILGSYDNYLDVEEWPTATDETPVISDRASKAKDPTKKDGLIGAFCRAYSIPDAIETFLPDVYTPANGNRYTYAKGTTAGGAVVYPYDRGTKDVFLYSNHQSDPVGGRLCNAFDLVRIHRFRALDAEAKPDTPVNKLPSFIAMQDLTRDDDRVKAELVCHDFDDIDSDGANNAWRQQLSYDRKGRVENTLDNLCRIIENDGAIKTRFNLFACRDIAVGRYLTDEEPCDVNDEILGRMARHIETAYSLRVSAKKVNDTLPATRAARGFDPIKEFITDTEWDGIERIGRLLVNYLGAADKPEIIEVTRKWMIAAVKRVFEPGCTFQNVLTLVGPQGTGKSTFFQTLAHTPEYYTDSLNVATYDKERKEATQGKWIIELSELVGLRRADWQSLKSYISRNHDGGRAAYAVRAENTPRRFVFGATTNDTNFLRDSDKGNRRWWVVECPGVGRDWRDELTAIVPQLWAEAYQYYKNGEGLEISYNTRTLMEAAQFEHSEDADDPLPGMIDEYLDTLLPADWDTRSAERRRAYYNNPDPLDADGIVRRTEFCAQAFLYECPGIGKKVSPQKINAIMRQKSDWQELKSLHRFNGYGPQRGFIRKPVSAETDDEDDI